MMMQYFNIILDKLNFEVLESKLARWQLKKLARLKAKYGPRWRAREMIRFLKRLMKNIKYFYSGLGSKFLNIYYKKWYERTLKFNLIFNKRSLRSKMVNDHYKYLFFVISFFDTILSQLSFTYPRKRKLFSRIDIRFIFKIYFAWFIKRPFLSVFKKFIELIIYNFGLKVFIKIFMIDNKSISAQFLSRYIAMAIFFKI